MPIGKLKNKLDSVFGDEVIGEVDGLGEVETPAAKPPKQPKPPRQKAEKPPKAPKQPKPAKAPKTVGIAPPVENQVFQTTSLEDQMASMWGSEESEFGYDDKNTVIKDATTVLTVLGIPSRRIPDVTDAMSFIEGTQFDITAPSGFDVSQVSQYCDKAEYVLKEVMTAFEEKEDDFDSLLKENTRLENKIVQRQHNDELTSMQLRGESAVETLQEQLIEANNRIMLANTQIAEANNEIAILRAERDKLAQKITLKEQDPPQTSDISPQQKPRTVNLEPLPEPGANPNRRSSGVLNAADQKLDIDTINASEDDFGSGLDDLWTSIQGGN